MEGRSPSDLNKPPFLEYRLPSSGMYGRAQPFIIKENPLSSRKGGRGIGELMTVDRP